MNTADHERRVEGDTHGSVLSTPCPWLFCYLNQERVPDEAVLVKEPLSTYAKLVEDESSQKLRLDCYQILYSYASYLCACKFSYIPRALLKDLPEDLAECSNCYWLSCLGQCLSHIFTFYVNKDWSANRGRYRWARMHPLLQHLCSHLYCSRP